MLLSPGKKHRENSKCYYGIGKTGWTPYLRRLGVSRYCLDMALRRASCIPYTVGYQPRGSSKGPLAAFADWCGRGQQNIGISCRFLAFPHAHLTPSSDPSTHLHRGRILSCDPDCGKHGQKMDFGQTRKKGEKWPKNGKWPFWTRVGQFSHSSAICSLFPGGAKIYSWAIFSHFGPEARNWVCTGQSESQILSGLLSKFHFTH